MRTRVKVHVHRNYVQTLVRFIKRPCSYVEFGVGSLRGPINVLNSTKLRADLETSVGYGVDDSFPEFPEIRISKWSTSTKCLQAYRGLRPVKT